MDTEFDEDGKTIELISIGIVAEDGRELYLTSSDFDPNRCNDWVKQHVLPHLPSPFDTDKIATRAQIRDRVVEFIGEDPQPQLWAYFADYDWVVFCQLFGKMVDLPPKIPRFCLDLKQLCYHYGVSSRDLPEQSGKVHDALEDARWNRDVFEFLLSSKATQPILRF